MTSLFVQSVQMIYSQTKAQFNWLLQCQNWMEMCKRGGCIAQAC